MNDSTFQTVGPQGFGTYRFDWKSGEMEQSDVKAEGLLIPGFVDIHIHGAFGHDFMSGSAEGLIAMADQLSKVGYEAFLPTTVTASLDSVGTAIERIPIADSRMPGFHLEGPFISPKHPGAQPQDFIVPPGPSWEPVLNDPRLRVITLASEVVGNLDLTRQLSNRGVIVSLGHTDATFEQVRQAVDHGASHTTHTYNAMRPLHHREAGTVGGAMLSPEIHCELIYDRIHVSQPAAELLLRSKGADRMIAVSDATMAAGMEAGQEITMWGLQCVVGDQQVRLKDGSLAGSGITLLDAFRNLAQDFGPEVAIKLCSLNPRRRLGLGSPRVWIVMDPEFQIMEIRESPPV